MEVEKLAKFVGNRIKELRDRRGMTQEELGEVLGISKQALGRYEAGLRRPNQDALFQLADFFNISLDSFFPERKPNNIVTIYEQLTAQRQTKVYNFAEYQLEEQNNKIVPLVGATAANPTALEYADAINDISINTDVPNNADCALVVRGNSMEPDYMDSSIVFYKRQEMVESGELAIVEIDGDGVTFKKILFDYDNQQVILRSLNKEYPDRVLKEESYRIVGKVIK